MNIHQSQGQQNFGAYGIPVNDQELVSIPVGAREAAQRMGVSRATFARVLAAARSVVAEALLEGKALEIGGGDVVTGPSRREGCPVHARKERRGRNCRCSRGTGQTQEA